jgi:hypothetical protein
MSKMVEKGVQGFTVHAEPNGPIPQRENNSQEVISYVRHELIDFAYCAVTSSGIERTEFLCDICHRWLYLGMSFSNLKKHVERRHLHEWDAVKDRMTRCAKPKPEGIWNLTMEQRKINLVLFITKRCMGFKAVEDPDLRMMAGVSINRDEAKRIVMKMNQECFIDLKALFKTISCIAISFDEWSDTNHSAYLGVRAYAIGPEGYSNWCLEHILLTSSATASAQASLLTRILDEKYGIRQKIAFAVTDNAPVMESAVTQLGLKRMPCFCHILNLMLGDILSEVSIAPIINFAGSVQNSQKFAKIAAHAEYKSIPTYCCTRWFSLWKLLRNSVALRREIEEFLSAEKRSGRRVIEISEDHWTAAKILVRVCETCRNAMLLLESDQFGSLSRAFQAFVLLSQACIVGHEGHNKDLMKQAWDKAVMTHWRKFVKDDVREIAIMAALLNPSVPLWYLSEMDVDCGKKRLSEEVAARNIAPRPEPREQRPTDRGWTLKDLNQVSCRDPDQTEVQAFMALDRESISNWTEFDLLKWWLMHRGSFPAIYEIAMKYLIIPATSAAAERQSSKAKRTQGLQRHSLKSQTLQAQVFVSENLPLVEKRFGLQFGAAAKSRKVS